MINIVIKDNLEVDVEYPKNVLNVHGDLPFLAERKKLKKMQQACL